MIRFFIVLWLTKLYDLFQRMRGRYKSDFAGAIANKLCPRFIELISKPKLIVAVTGTNGKTTTSHFVNARIRETGLTTTFNDWGANVTAGYAINFIRSVSIFNRPKVDCSVLEMDEVTSDWSMPLIRPQYIIVTNICVDSIGRNGHPENIFWHLDNAFKALGSDTKILLNANDPISANLGLPEQRIYYGMADQGMKPYENRTKDISYCPKCFGPIRYRSRLYRHLGDFFCEDCDYSTPEITYLAEKVDLENRKMLLREGGEITEYPLLSDKLFNAFNVISAAALFREMGYSREVIADFFKTQKIVESRETCVEAGGIKYYAHASKGQNGSSCSTVFEFVKNQPTVKEIVLLMDEAISMEHATETVTWMYEADFELLKDDKIKKIIVGGHMHKNYELRLRLAGIPEDRIVCVPDEYETPGYVDRTGIDEVYVLYDIDTTSRGKKVRDMIVELKKEEANG